MPTADMTAGSRLLRHPLLAPFRIRSFRFQWPADLLTSWAFEMETLILGWYILTETRSVLLLTVFGALQYVGTLLSPAIGMLGDRLGHRNTLCGMRALYSVLAALLLAIAMAGAITPLIVLVIAALNGLARPSDLALRQTLVAETMPPEQFVGAMGIARTTSDSARIGGALAGAAVFAALGMGLAYVFVTGCYLAGLLLTLGVSRSTRRAHPGGDAPARPSPFQQMIEGLIYVWKRPHMLAGMWIAFLVNFTAFPLSGGILPYVAREIYHMNQTGLGMLVASFATGALLGSISVTMRSKPFPLARTSIIATFVWYAALLALAQATTPAVGMICLFIAGFTQSWSMIPLAVMLLKTADEAFRGRVMGARMLAIYGLPTGLLLAGALIGRIGFQATASLFAISGIAFTALIALKWRSAIWHPEAPANRH